MIRWWLICAAAACNGDALSPGGGACDTYVECVVACGPRRVAPDWSACEHTCNLALSAPARELLVTAQDCYTAACHDAGRCTADGKDPVGVTFRTCFDCRDTAAAQLFASCPTPGDPACDPPDCRAASAACLDDGAR